MGEREGLSFIPENTSIAVEYVVLRSASPAPRGWSTVYTSGAMKRAVPQLAVWSRSFETPGLCDERKLVGEPLPLPGVTSRVRKRRESPKSTSLMRSELVSMKFDGLMSRWMRNVGLRLWRYATAFAISEQKRRFVAVAIECGAVRAPRCT